MLFLFLLKASVEACQRNIKFNGSVAISKVESHHTDARVHMLTHPKEFDVVSIYTHYCVHLYIFIVVFVKLILVSNVLRLILIHMDHHLFSLTRLFNQSQMVDC